MTASVQSRNVLICTLAASVLVAGLTASGPAKAGTAPTKKVDFNRDVRPILSEHCFRCHGPDAAAVAAGLRLDQAETATADRGGYFAIVPGHPERSKVYTKISAKEEYMRMPPVDSGVAPLSEDQIETIRLWIEAGAVYRPHWAFVPPEEHASPKISDAKWVRQGLDAFVMARLDDAGLKPEPEADVRTLVRRASLILTGLPPSVDEVEAVLDDSAPGAYERYVDRLLASSRYGEHQARYWLDAVRYGDTHGLHLDNERSVWPYRDWVVRAFNEDLPLDKFAQWQLAGDLLPNPTTEQLIATGYVRMNPTTNEGGAIEAEFLTKNTFDRVDTMGTVFLGLTVGCAKCHDHKYDPITQKEYYGLYAYFNSTTDSPLDGNLLAPGPAIKASTPAQDAVVAGWRRERASLEDRVNQHEALVWAKDAHTEPAVIGNWQVAGPYSAKDFEAAFATAFDPEDANKQPVWRDLQVDLGKPKASIINVENAAAYVRTVVTAPVEQDVVLRLGSDDGIKAWLNGKLIHDNKVLRALTADADSVKVHLTKGPNTLVFKIVNAGGQDGFYMAVGDPRADRINKAYNGAKDTDAGAEAQRELAAVFLEFGPESTASNGYRSVLKKTSMLEDSLPMTIVANEMPEPRETRLLARGEYDQPKEVVQRGVPASLGRLPEGSPENRLGLAYWITSKDNPLFARVFVNRIWQQYFGKGLVQSAENFGSQGAWPSDSELLDHLSVELRKSGLSVKSLHRMIVTSATFRQASSVSAEKRARDPENVLLSRGPRFRLDAEVIRDQALKVSGLLVEQLGGRGVKTYQPPGLWEAVGYTSSNTAKYVQDHGEALYRRSLYLFWKRTSPPPGMTVFDAPSREACIVSRSRTNTPLQALVSLNGRQYVEAARVMAERLLKTPGDDRAHVAAAFEGATARRPSAEEVAVILQVLGSQRSHFKGDKGAAVSLVSTGEFPRDESLNPVEHAAWTVVCNLILNLDEVVTIH